MPPFGKGSLQLAGVVGLAVGHQAVAGCIHKERFSLGDKGQTQGLALGLHAHGVLGTGQQGEQGEHIGIACFVDSLAVQGNDERMGRAEAQAVFQLEHGTAGHGTDQGQVHEKTS